MKPMRCLPSDPFVRGLMLSRPPSQMSAGWLWIFRGLTISFCLGLAITVSKITPVNADPTDWAPSLKAQLQAEKSCQFLYMLNVREFRFLDRDIVEARVYCDDGRIFDVTRRSPDMLFEIKECSLNTC